MPRSPHRPARSQAYADAWRAINLLIRSDGTWSGRERNLCFRNRGDGRFDDISYVSGLDLDADGRAFVPLDLDSDGDLDLIVKNRNGRQLRAFRNDLRDQPARLLSLRLEGRASNRDGVGARVEVETSRREMTREIVSGSGYLSQRARRAEFGLLDGEAVRRIRVRWPLGAIQEFTGPFPGLDLACVESEPALQAAQSRPLSRPEPEPAGAAAEASVPGTWLAVPVPAPDFRLETVSPQAAPAGFVRLADRRSGSILLNFWATWCPPCRRELQDLNGRIADFRRADVEILAVSVDEPDRREAVSALADELQLEFPVLLADARTAEAYSILNERLFDRRRNLAIPTSFLLDPQGRIVKAYRGETDSAMILRDARAGRGPALPFEGRWAISGPRRRFEDLGAAFAERGLQGPARRMFQQALADGNRSPGLLNNLAGALIADGETRQGERLLREALAADPGLADANINLAALLIERDEAAEAETLLRATLANDPNDSQALSMLGSLWFSQNRLADAQDLFQRAVRASPDEPRYRENLGAALASRNRFSEAAQEYETALELGSANTETHTNLGVLYMQLNRSARAREAFLEAVAAAPQAPAAHLNLSRYYLHEGDTQRALAAAQRANALSPGDPAPLLLEARALAAQGQRTQARQAAREALRLQPGSEEAAAVLDSLR